MKTPMLPFVSVLPLLAAIATAQYNVGPAGGTFIPIANTTGAAMLPIVSACDDCTEPLVLSFPFPWFGSNVTTLTVSSNGAVLMGAFTDTLCCSNWALDFGTSGGTPTYFTPRPWIAIAQEDLYPIGQGDVWRLNTPSSTIISWENCAFFGTTGASLNAQVELYISGDIEIRFGVSNTVGNPISTGLANPGTTNVWFSPNSVLTAYNGVGQVASAAVPQNTGVRFAPGAGNWETNSPTSRMTFNSIVGTAYTKALTTACLGGPVTAISFGTAGQPWEVGYNFASTVGATTAGALVTGGGQIVNLNLGQGLFFLGGGGPLPSFKPHPGLFSVSFAAPLGTFSAEQLVFDPTNPEGVSLSQACQLDSAGVLALPPTPLAGPTSSSTQVVVPIGCATFFGRAFSQMFVQSNGRVVFGNSATISPPSAAQFAAGGPSFGVWCDLNPAAGGSVLVTVPNAGIINVAYTGVPYVGTSVLNTFQLEFDTNTGIVSIIGLSGLGASASAQQLIGISGGTAVGATNAGAVNFSPGGTGTTGTTNNGTDMIYAIGNQGAVTTGINRIDFIPNPQANYDWISQ